MVGWLVVHWYNVAEFGAPALVGWLLVVHWYTVVAPEFGAELGELAQKRVAEDASTDELVKDASTTDELVQQ